MAFDRPLGVGARGGHGPIRYFVEEHTPGRYIKFRFTGPRGFDGFHSYECIQESDTVQLRHTLEMTPRGLAILTWPLVFHPLHDALLEDSLTTAEASLGLPLHVQPWSFRVRVLRWLLSRGLTPTRVIRPGG